MCRSVIAVVTAGKLVGSPYEVLPPLLVSVVESPIVQADSGVVLGAFRVEVTVPPVPGSLTALSRRTAPGPWLVPASAAVFREVQGHVDAIREDDLDCFNIDLEISSGCLGQVGHRSSRAYHQAGIGWSGWVRR